MKLNHSLALSIIVLSIAACSTANTPATPQVQEIITLNQTSYYNSIWFEINSDKISDDFDAIIELNADYLKSNPIAQVQIQGNSSEVGSTSHAIKLANLRAKAVTDRLIASGVNKVQIQEVSFGTTRPLFLSDKKGKTAKNRRADIIYISGAPMSYFIDTLPIITTEDETFEFESMNVRSQTGKIKSTSSAPAVSASQTSQNSTTTVAEIHDDNSSSPVMITQ